MVGSGVEAKTRPDRTIFSAYSGVYKPTLFTTQISQQILEPRQYSSLNIVQLLLYGLQ